MLLIIRFLKRILQNGYKVSVLAVYCAGLLEAPAEAVDSKLQGLRASVFKIQVRSQVPQYSLPWKSYATRSGSGSGLYIGKKRILTNAHVVAHGKFITVQMDGDDRPRLARVEFIAHDCDLAILKIVNDSDFKYPKALQLGSLPRLREPVAVVGYPMGGEQISITEGIVSRISFRRYAHVGYQKHLLVQVDSAINPGNSGGPVFQGELLVGVAFQAHTTAENTGYVIPTVVIERFLKDIEDGAYDGHPPHGIEVLSGAMENPTARFYHGMEPQEGGVEISHIDKHVPSSNVLQVGDIVIAIDEKPIGVDGRVLFQGERVDFRVLYDLKQRDDVARFTIRRLGKKQLVSVKILPVTPHYNPNNTYSEYPRYLVFSGLVFTALSRDYLSTWGKRWFHDGPTQLRYLHSAAKFYPEFTGVSDIVVLSKKLPDSITAHMEKFEDHVVKKVNGMLVTGLSQLQDLIQANKEPFLVIEFLDVKRFLVLPALEAKRKDKSINTRYGVTPTFWFGSKNNDGATSGR